MIHVFRNCFPNVHTPGHLQKFQPNTRMCALSKFPASKVNRKVSTLFQHHNSSRKLHLCLYSWCGRSWRLQFPIIVPRQRTHKYSKVHMCGTKLTFCNFGWKKEREKKSRWRNASPWYDSKLWLLFFSFAQHLKIHGNENLIKILHAAVRVFFLVLDENRRRWQQDGFGEANRLVFFFCFLVPDPEPNGFRRFVLACRTEWCWFVNHEEFGGSYERGDVLGW